MEYKDNHYYACVKCKLKEDELGRIGCLFEDSITVGTCYYASTNTKGEVCLKLDKTYYRIPFKSVDKIFEFKDLGTDRKIFNKFSKTIDKVRYQFGIDIELGIYNYDIENKQLIYSLHAKRYDSKSHDLILNYHRFCNLDKLLCTISDLVYSLKKMQNTLIYVKEKDGVIHRSLSDYEYRRMIYGRIY